jgi:hypothetical protein
MERFVARAVCVLSVALAAACSTSVRRGEALYGDGQYIEAAEVFERNEYQLPELSPRQQAEYGLYRGMTLEALGDARNAQLWMKYAFDVERANPGSLTAERHALLARAWSSLQPQGPNVAAPPPGTAIAASQPSPPIAPPPLAAPAPNGPVRPGLRHSLAE